VLDKYASGNGFVREKPSIPVGAAIKLSCLDCHRISCWARCDLLFRTAILAKGKAPRGTWRFPVSKVSVQGDPRIALKRMLLSAPKTSGELQGSVTRVRDGQPGPARRIRYGATAAPNPEPAPQVVALSIDWPALSSRLPDDGLCSQQA